MIRNLAALTALLTLPACAVDQGRYPSLAVRDVERATGTFEPVETVDVVIPSPAPSEATLARLSDLTASARAIHAEFGSATPAASRAVSAGKNSSVESDSWASAQVALSDLESIRSRAAVPLADIESLYVDARLAAQSLDEVAAARTNVLTLIAEEDAVLARLRGQMAQ